MGRLVCAGIVLATGMLLAGAGGDIGRAEYDRGRAFADGHGVPHDDKKAAEWYRKAAEHGYARAQVALGWMYEMGRGVERSAAQAVGWYRRAAAQGYAPAQHNLGVMYEEGRGVKRDDKQAAAWYRKAAAQGYGRAQTNLGVMYEEGRGVKRDDKQAAAWFRKAAAQDIARAQYNLGLMYDQGRGVKLDYAQAVAWFRKAAEAGHAPAQTNLGWMYKEGRGVKRDYAQAVAWFRKAATQGDAWGQNDLGLMYDQGRGVKRDYRQAVAWYRKAAATGHAMALNNLGAMYENGLGVPRDLAAAGMLYRIAASRGSTEAQSALRRHPFREQDRSVVTQLHHALRIAWSSTKAGGGFQPPEGHPLLSHGLRLQAGGDDEAAVTQLRESLAREGELALTHLALGSSLLALGRDNEARRETAKAIGLEEGASDAWPVLVAVMLGEEVKDFSPLDGWNPAGAEGLFLHAMVNIVRHRSTYAISDLERALALKPSKPLAAAIHSAMAEVRIHSAFAMKDALSALDSAITLAPAQGLYRVQRAWLRYLGGDASAALADARKAIELLPLSLSPLGYELRARAVVAARRRGEKTG